MNRAVVARIEPLKATSKRDLEGAAPWEIIADLILRGVRNAREGRAPAREGDEARCRDRRQGGEA